ncbi:hypothetical protein N7468_007235 [Penicillium chermesinum]|uniref:Uncharacterized protein n=1 Tax=Penicillium chermesinum TaxID=63820 RepID=A0A9W9TLZ4_9EURO|nr:uncharacterized protein N7468_007235 [Penicillium chermesinum]KAJ5226010.1 hypothetical protein N7468_007235 [Penicillium chermesinum]
MDFPWQNIRMSECSSSVLSRLARPAPLHLEPLDGTDHRDLGHPHPVRGAIRSLSQGQYNSPKVYRGAGKTGPGMCGQSRTWYHRLLSLRTYPIAIERAKRVLTEVPMDVPLGSAT